MKPETDQTNAEPIDPPRSEPDPKPGDVGVWEAKGLKCEVRLNESDGRSEYRFIDLPAGHTSTLRLCDIKWHRRLAVVPEADACGWVPEERAGMIFYGTSCKAGEIAYEDEPNFDQHPFCPGCGRRVEAKEGEG